MIQVEIKLLPDRSKVRIHWFCRRPEGPIFNSAAVMQTAMGPISLGGGVGCIACQPGRKVLNEPQADGIFRPTVHSDDVRAVTCPECMATAAYAAVKRSLDENLEINPKDIEIHKMAMGAK